MTLREMMDAVFFNMVADVERYNPLPSELPVFPATESQLELDLEPTQ